MTKNKELEIIDTNTKDETKNEWREVEYPEDNSLFFKPQKETQYVLKINNWDFRREVKKFGEKVDDEERLWFYCNVEAINGVPLGTPKEWTSSSYFLRQALVPLLKQRNPDGSITIKYWRLGGGKDTKINIEVVE